MQLMVSVISGEEAYQALQGGADILDIKNPDEGSLGAQPPRIIREITGIASGKVPVSAAIGDMPDLPGTAALAALGAASCGVDYVKVGLFGMRDEKDAVTLLREIVRAVDGFGVSIIAAAYADFERAGTMNPAGLPQAAAAAGIRGCLLDTAVKDGRRLFDFLHPDALRALADDAHSRGLLFGIAGSLRDDDVPLITELGADIAGFRTAVCGNNRRGGPLEAARVQNLSRLLCGRHR